MNATTCTPMTVAQRGELVDLITQLEEKMGDHYSANAQLVYMIVCHLDIIYTLPPDVREAVRKHFKVVMGTDLSVMMADWLTLHTEGELTHALAKTDAHERAWSIQELLTVITHPYTSMKRVIEADSHMFDPQYISYEVIKRNVEWASAPPTPPIDNAKA